MRPDIQTSMNCPDCGKPLWYDAGTWGSTEEPPDPEVLYCATCGYERHPDKRDIKRIENQQEK